MIVQYVNTMSFRMICMMRSEPEFDPSSKEINKLERRDAIVAIIAINSNIAIL